MNEERQIFLDECRKFLEIFEDSGLRKKEGRDEAKMKETTLQLLKLSMKTPGEAEAVFDWMERNEFWTSPASSRFHANYKGGLADHSLEVAYHSIRLAPAFFEDFWMSKKSEGCNVSAGDIFVSALCHDFCKAGMYGIEYRNTKSVTGSWTYTPHYKVKGESRCLGHGNESVLRLLECAPSYFKNRPVLEAISRHMGFSDLSENEGYNYSNFLDNPLVLLLQAGDQISAAWYDC